MQLVLFIIYFWSWDTVRAVYDLCVTGDPMTPNDLCFSFKRNILSFTFILITLLSIKTVDYIRPSRFVVDVWIGIITALAPFDPGSFTFVMVCYYCVFETDTVLPDINVNVNMFCCCFVFPPVYKLPFYTFVSS